MPEAVLVTGATGFIGKRLCAALNAMGSRVQALSSRDGDIADSPISANGDVAHVFHLAARSFVPGSWTETHEYYRTNVLGTQRVLELCRHTGASLTFLSSYVYGQPEYLPINEEHPVRPLNPYSHTKILGEELVTFYTRQFRVKATIIRPFNIYGPGQASTFLIPLVVAKALSATSAVIEVADIRPKRDYLYIDDFVDLLVRARNRHEGVFNAGSGASISVADVVEIVNSLAPQVKQVVSRSDERPAEVMDVVADVSKARRELGWKPKTSLLDGLRATIEWAKGNITS